MAPEPAELTLEVVSPLFIGGADPRSSDVAREGVRPPSLRGALRFWFRALLAADDRESLSGRESELFGSASRPSAVVTRVRPLSEVRSESWEKLRAQGGSSRPAGSPGSGRPRAPFPAAGGLGYLGDVALRRTRVAPERTAISPGARYRLELRWRGREADGKACQFLAASLWLLTHLGSLGARANRGFGALQAEVERPGFLKDALVTFTPAVSASSSEELAEELRTAAGSLRSLRVGRMAVREYPNLSVCEVRVAEPIFPGWPEALEWIGSLYRAHRTGLQRNRRLPFGLPIPMRGGQALTVDGLTRRTSPLRFRLVKLASGSYAIVVLLFKDRLFPKTPADHRVLEAFLQRVGGHAVPF